MEDYPKTLLEFEQRFSTEDACVQYLFGLRWPFGFSCPLCGNHKAWKLKAGSPRYTIYSVYRSKGNIPESDFSRPDPINSTHTRYFNLKNKTSGHVWQGRFKSPIVGEDSPLMEVSRYIELNPIRANIVKLLEEYQWSSYAAHAYGRKNSLIDEHIYYESLGRTKEERQARYREFVKEGLKEEKLKEIRDSIISGKGYGSEEYLQKVEESIKARLRKGRRGRPKKKDV